MSENADSVAPLTLMNESASPWSARPDPVAVGGRWVAICRLAEIVPDTGVCALIEGVQVAVFRVGSDPGRVYALGNRDPFSGAQVMARGLVGDRGGVLKVASPLYKQSFALETGACLDDSSKALPVYRCRVRDGLIEVASP
jgi:nitrite reductase (NADH) small subunit